MVRKKGSQCVKFLAENWTWAIVVCTRVWATAHKTRTLTNTSASGCRACCSQLTKTVSWKHRDHLLETQRPSAGNTETICWKYRNHLLKTQKPPAENTETTCWKYRNHLPLAASFQLVGKALNPNWWLGRLSMVFRLFPSLSARLSFACRHLVSYSFDVVCCSFKNKPDKMVSNQTKSKRLS